ncbi:MAG: trypsin-like peptidase domain-containing protein [Magnetococcales bacterium]|nr:trypsin-like peptidase domain-containing protein [Magnetococcales bacterium]
MQFPGWLLIWIMMLATILGLYVVLTSDSSNPEVPKRVEVVDNGAVSAQERHLIELFKNASPSVVYIITRTRRGKGAAVLRSAKRVGTGSGFLWDGKGHVVTNHHVLTGAEEILVRVADDKLVPAKLIGAAADYDLAVLRLTAPPKGIRPLSVGASSSLQVGQTVYAIGNPYGLSRTLTSGIISALNRRLPTRTQREIRGVIQTDAAINPGNSGGPLLDSSGRLIGVNTAIISESGGSTGIGFAVPVSVVNRVVPDLIAKGKVEKPGIGILILSEEESARIGVTGVVIESVIKGGPAEAAGLRGVDRRRGRLGDVITQVNGKQVRTVADVATAFQRLGISKKAVLTLRRSGRLVRVRVEIVDIS